MQSVFQKMQSIWKSGNLVFWNILNSMSELCEICRLCIHNKPFKENKSVACTGGDVFMFTVTQRWFIFKERRASSATYLHTVFSFVENLSC